VAARRALLRRAGISDNLPMAKRRIHRPEGTPAVSRERPPRRKQVPRVQDASGSSRRARFERASAPWLVRISALPTFLIPALMGIALFFGLVVPYRWAGLLLVPLALFLAWLAALSWPSLSVGSRALRVLVAVGMGVLAMLKLAGVL
jgi:Family of unknown function (DUF6703)